MKKLISLLVALALVLSLGVTAFAFETPAGISSLAIVGSGIPGVGEWKPEDPAGDMELVGDYVYEKTLSLTAGTTMKFKFAGNDMWDDTCNFGSAAVALDQVADLVCSGGSGDMTFTADKDMDIKITVDLSAFVNGGAATVLIQEVVAGGEVTPEVVISDTAVTTDENASDGIRYTWTAPSAGTVNVTITNFDLGWWYTIDVSGEYGAEYKDSEYDELSIDYSVAAGTNVKIDVGAYDPDFYFKQYGFDLGGEAVAGSVSFEVSFVASGESGGEGGDVDVAGSSQENAIALDPDMPWHFIEAGATVWFVADDSADAQANGVYSQILNISSGADYSVTYREQNVPVDADGFVNYELYSMNYSGVYYIAVTNLSEEKGFFTIEIGDKPAYVNTYANVYLGDNDITLDPSAAYTLWEFQPTKDGTYKFTIPDAAGLVGNWGMSSYPQDNTPDKTNTLIWTCTSVGQSILVGVAGVDSTVLNISRVSDYTPEEELPWTFYENTYTFDYEIPEGNVIAIDVTDEVADVAVLGNDGFYHYGSANGPLMVCDLSNVKINILEAYGNGQLRCYVYDENGILVARIDYNEAMLEYYNNGLCPLTEELAEMIQRVGHDKAWWVAGGFVFTDSEPLNEEDAWMAFCGFVEGTETEGNEPEGEKPGDNKPEDEKPGDNKPEDEKPGDNKPEDEKPGDNKPEDEKPVVMSDYYVAGVAGLCGSDWKPGEAANQMVDAGNGMVKITYKNVAAGSYEFKITKGASWDQNWGVDGANGKNFVLDVKTAGDVTITFNTATGEISVETATGSVDSNPQTGDMSIAAVTMALLTATAGAAVVLGKKKEF